MLSGGSSLSEALQKNFSLIVGPTSLELARSWRWTILYRGTSASKDVAGTSDLHMGGSWERMIGVARRILDSMLLQQKSRLTHEVLSTLMAEITAIINARPLLPVSTDPHQPFILSPAILLTQKSGVPPPPGDFTDKDLFTKQWRHVQALANQFWARWSKEYLPSLQQRQKWTVTRRNLQVGDLVLLRDKQTIRNYWPMAIVTATFPGNDGHVRKVEVKMTDQGDTRTFLRPVAEVVLLLPKD